MSDDLTNEEAAAWLKVHPLTLHRWRQRGTGPEWYRLGERRIYYRKADLKAYLEGTRNEFLLWVRRDKGFRRLSTFLDMHPTDSIFELACFIDAHGTMELAKDFEDAIEAWANRT